MEKTLTVTIKMDKDKPTRIEFLEPESGDTKVYRDDLRYLTEKDFVEALGMELYSWIELMKDEVEDNLEA